MKNIILKAVNICKYFEKNSLKILDGINLELIEGKSIAIMGSSGEGKTTLLHILGGLESPTCGEIYLNSEKLSSKNSSHFRSSYIGYIFQNFNLLEDLSLSDNIAMPALIFRKNKKEILLKVKSLLKETALEERGPTLAKFLSGGEKQRAAIARSFCNDPKIILADEPSGNLDYTNSKIIHNLLISFVKKKNKSLIVATHDEELANLCDEVYLLKNGTFFK